MSEKTYSSTDAANILGVTLKTLLRWEGILGIEIQRVGKNRRFTEENLAAIEEARRLNFAPDDNPHFVTPTKARKMLGASRKTVQGLVDAELIESQISEVTGLRHLSQRDVEGIRDRTIEEALETQHTTRRGAQQTPQKPRKLQKTSNKEGENLESTQGDNIWVSRAQAAKIAKVKPSTLNVWADREKIRRKKPPRNRTHNLYNAEDAARNRQQREHTTN